MDYQEMTAPCGLDCFNCPSYLASDDEVFRKSMEARLKERGLPVNKVTCRGRRTEKGTSP